MASAGTAERLKRATHRFGVPRREGHPVERALRHASWAGFVSLLVWTNPAAEGHRLRSVLRLWEWQVWRRTARRGVEVALPTGGRLYFPPWSTLAGVTLGAGLHEPAEQLFVASYVRPGECVIDVGANLGLYTIPCARAGAFVLAFEPSTRTRAVLERNVGLNALRERVRVLPYAVAAENRNAVLTTDLDGANHLVAAGSETGPAEVVEQRRLDSVVESQAEWLAGHAVGLIKVDAEGYDEEVLRGGVETIATHRPVIIVESWEGGVSVRAFLASLGYRVYCFVPESGRLVEYASSWSGQANFIAIADERKQAVGERVSGRATPYPPIPHVRWRGNDLTAGPAVVSGGT